MAKSASPVARFWAEFRESRVAVGALLVVAVIVLLALFAPLIAPQDPYDLARLVLSDARRPPGYAGSGGYTGAILGGAMAARRALAALPVSKK